MLEHQANVSRQIIEYWNLRYGNVFGDNFFSHRYIVFDKQSGHNRIGISGARAAMVGTG